MSSLSSELELFGDFVVQPIYGPAHRGLQQHAWLESVVTLNLFRLAVIDAFCCCRYGGFYEDLLNL